MRKRIVFMVTACVLVITGCGVSNSAEDPAGADSQMVENTNQIDTEKNTTSENIDNTHFEEWRAFVTVDEQEGWT